MIRESCQEREREGEKEGLLVVGTAMVRTSKADACADAIVVGIVVVLIVVCRRCRGRRRRRRSRRSRRHRHDRDSVA